MVDAMVRAEGLDMVDAWGATERVDTREVKKHVSGAAQILKCIWQCDAPQSALLSPRALLSRPSSARPSESLSREGSRSTHHAVKDEATADTTYLRDWSLSVTIMLPHATSSRSLASSVLRALCLACRKFSQAWTYRSGVQARLDPSGCGVVGIDDFLDLAQKVVYGLLTPRGQLRRSASERTSN